MSILLKSAKNTERRVNVNTDSYIAPVWQLRVNAEGMVPLRSKAHCFVDDTALCKTYMQKTSLYDDGISWRSDEILERPYIACKRCLSRWKRLYQIAGD